jgi:hypothetical protein
MTNLTSSAMLAGVGALMSQRAMQKDTVLADMKGLMTNGNGQHAPPADEVPEADCPVVAGAVTGNTTLL